VSGDPHHYIQRKSDSRLVSSDLSCICIGVLIHSWSTDARGSYSFISLPCTVNAQMTRMSTVIMMVDQIG
jgi:hypothetical protein